MPAKRILTAALSFLIAVSFAAPSGARALSDAGFEYWVEGTSATVVGCTVTCPAELVIPGTLGGYSVTSIGWDAFKENALTSVTIPDSVTSIGEYAFEDNALTSVTIPDSVTSIGGGAFADNALTTVTFLGNAPTAGTDVFGNNSGLTSVTRSYTATGWGSTWSGVPVVTAAAPTPTPTSTPTPTPTPSLTSSPEPSASSDPGPSVSPDTGGEEPTSTDGDAAPWLIALLLLLASVTVTAGIRRRQRASRRN